MNKAPLENLRGDYAGMAPDWTVSQHVDLYSDEDQAVWRLLLERQTALAREHACEEFLQGLRTLGIGDSIPDFESVNARLEPLTGWRIVGVPGLIPDAVFYDHLAHRRFPVTVWIRSRAELDYLVEPDLFHDFFGHVPLLERSGVRRLHAGLRPARRRGRREDRPAGAALLVHGRVRPDPHAQGPEGLWRGHPVLGGRSEARASWARTSSACRSKR